MVVRPGLRRSAAKHAALTHPHSSPKNNAMPNMGNSGRARWPGMYAISFLLLTVQLMSVGHQLLVSHVTCPEHGDIIHVGQSHEASHGQRVAGEDALGHPSQLSIVGTAPWSDSDHDHCLICTITHDRFALFPPISQPLASIEVAVSLPPSLFAGPFSPVDLIVLSPKNSPPAV
jgi:hypothetical protein